MNRPEQDPIAAAIEASAPPLKLPAPSADAHAIEPRWQRIVFLLIAIGISVGYAFFLCSFLVPAPGRPGIDENAYLLAGRNIAQHFTTGYKPADDYQFVGAMWVRTEDGWYYPKYPFGLPLLNAIPVLLGHPGCAFFISPICASLAILGMFFLARGIVGSFYALLAMIVLATGPTTLQLANMPNSHAPTLFFVVWGMFFLLWWWKSGRWFLGVLAGLLLGYAVTIRYTEALLLFPLYSLRVVKFDDYLHPNLITALKLLGFLPLGPIGIAALSRVRWREWRSYLSAAIPIAAWSVPVGVLVLFNYFTVGDITGYDTTNESSGFSVSYFIEKWDFTIYQIYLFGLFVFAPLGLVGLILMFRSARREAVLLVLWFVPGALLYNAYYWGDSMQSIAFLRFFLTLFPPLIIAAMWLMRSTETTTKFQIATPLATGVLTVLTAAVGLWGSIGDMERQYLGTTNLHYSAQRILAQVEPTAPRPMFLADSGIFPQLLQYMQFMLDADWYATDIFGLRIGGGFGLAGLFQSVNADAPVALQTDRINYIDSVRKGKTDADILADAHRLMDQALDANRHVYVVLTPPEVNPFRRRFVREGYEMVELDKWTEPCQVQFPLPQERQWLSLPVWGDSIFIPWQPKSRMMFEIRRAAAPATQPASQPIAAGQ